MPLKLLVGDKTRKESSIGLLRTPGESLGESRDTPRSKLDLRIPASTSMPLPSHQITVISLKLNKLTRTDPSRPKKTVGFVPHK
jgi:hypothetical protein